MCENFRFVYRLIVRTRLDKIGRGQPGFIARNRDGKPFGCPTVSVSFLGFGLLRFGEEIAEAVEAFLPEGAALFDPLFGYGQASGFDAAGADSADFFGVHQAAFFQDLQVLNDGGEGYVERSCEARYGNGAFAQFLDDGAARGVAECLEDAVDAGLLIEHLAYLRGSFVD